MTQQLPTILAPLRDPRVGAGAPAAGSGAPAKTPGPRKHPTASSERSDEGQRGAAGAPHCGSSLEVWIPPSLPPPPPGPAAPGAVSAAPAGALAGGGAGEPAAAARTRAGSGGEARAHTPKADVSAGAISDHFAEVLGRLSEHEALLRQLLEMAQAQANSAAKPERALMEDGSSLGGASTGFPQHLDCKTERAPGEATQPRAADDCPATPDSGLARLGKSCPSAAYVDSQEEGGHRQNSKNSERRSRYLQEIYKRSNAVMNLQPGRLSFQKIVENPGFNMMVSVVIVCNSVLMGIDAQHSMDYALTHTGQRTEWQPQGWSRALSLSFATFYALELSARLLAYSSSFFCGAEWGWNWFDFMLVAMAIYEAVVMLAVDGSGPGDVAWLRLLKLLKFVKMLRLFRLMRLFRELRTLVVSMLGSSMVLLWSIVLVVLMKYVVGLMLMQCLSSYLLETPLEDIDANTLDGVVANWFSVSEAIVSLFKATTGGNDWADLAQPIRVASASSYSLFYGMFMLYIVFFIVVLLNVLTGRLLDKAVKGFWDRDHEEMVNMMIEGAYSDGTVGNFEKFVLDQMKERCSHDGIKFSWDVVREHRYSEPVKELLGALHLDFKEAGKLFKALQMAKGGPGSLVSVSEFVRACEKKLKDGDVMIASLEHEVRRIGEIIDCHSEEVFRSRSISEIEALRSSGRAQTAQPTCDSPGTVPMP